MLPRPPVPRTVLAAPCPNRLVFVLVLKPRGLVQRINRGYANSSDAPLLKCWRTGSGKKRLYLSRHVYAYRTFCSSLSTNLLLSSQASSFGPRLIVRSTPKPTVLLSDCHRRIEMFLGVLHRIAELENRLLTKGEQGSLEKAVLVQFGIQTEPVPKRRFVIFTRLPRSIRRMRNNPFSHGLDTIRRLKFNQHSGNSNAWRVTTNAPLRCMLKSNCSVSAGWQSDI
jgi:hypothetical protein